MSAAMIDIQDVSHDYGRRRALAQLSLAIERGEIFAFLGPNGSGKTTLFRLLSTLIPLQSGNIEILGMSLMRQTEQVRRGLGVVFQSPSLDGQLTVGENIRHQGRLYGLSGTLLRRRQDELLGQLGLRDRVSDRVATLSGGLRRRVELAKGMLHQPKLLLLDEPTTGLDPGARSDLWEYLGRVREANEMTIVLTTHLLDEADRADRIAILDQGRLVALDTPDALRAEIGGDSITIRTDEPAALAKNIQEKFQCQTRELDGSVRLEQRDGHRWVAQLVEAFPDQISSITLGKPTLEDVFIDRTGHRFWQDDADTESGN